MNAVGILTRCNQTGPRDVNMQKNKLHYIEMETNKSEGPRKTWN